MSKLAFLAAEFSQKTYQPSAFNYELFVVRAKQPINNQQTLILYIDPKRGVDTASAGKDPIAISIHELVCLVFTTFQRAIALLFPKSDRYSEQALKNLTSLNC